MILFRKFLGWRVFTLLLLSIAGGIALSLVEVGFSFIIQSFLVSMGVIDLKVANLPQWVPSSFNANLGFLAAFALLRGITQWFKVYAHQLTYDSFAFHVRSMIANWALLTREGEASRVMTFLTDRVGAAASLMTAFQNGCIHGFSLLFLLIFLFLSAPTLAGAGFIVLVFFAMLLRFLDRKVKFAGEQLNVASGQINESMLDALKNLHFLRICRAEMRELSKIRQALRHYFKHSRIFLAVKSTKFAAPQVIGVFVIILISIYNQRFQVLVGGAFVSFVYLFIRASQTSADLSTVFATVRMYKPQFLDLFEWWKTKGRHAPPIPKEHDDKHTFALKEKSKFDHKPIAWNAKGLSFSYDKSPILKDFHLQIPAGSLTLVTGPSGRGKSTLLDLLGGILEPASGNLSIEPSTLSVKEAVEKAGLRFGYVGPDPYVVGGTVRENLKYGLDYEPTEAQIIEALELAHCKEFLTNLPSDLDRKISERGEGFSTGQKQRLALARALLRQPTALLLDEPTANLDSISEAAVIEALQKLKGRITMAIVTHRKPLFDIADKIVELS